MPASKKPTPGERVNFYLHPPDRERITRLRTFLSAKGFRVNDSQVVKAALRAAKEDAALVKAFESILENDARRKGE